MRKTVVDQRDTWIKPAETYQGWNAVIRNIKELMLVRCQTWKGLSPKIEAEGSRYASWPGWPS